MSARSAVDLMPPTADQLLEATTSFSRDIHLEMSESAMVERFLDVLADLFPGRRVAVRTFDPRSREDARVYSRAELRSDVESERISLKTSAVEKTRLKDAVRESARIRVGGRWDTPFPLTAVGFSVPLAASGELYGVLDLGYPLGVGPDVDEADELAILPLANQLSVALRNERLHRETTVLRDYQAKLIEHANALILGVDRDWRITVCNQALVKLTGFEREELIGRDLRDWLPEDQRPRLQKLFLQALAGGHPDTVDVTLMTRDGGRVRTLWSVATISGRHHQVEAVVAIGQDQTRLQELQDQVIQAEKLATLGQLAAGVVHELNNPLTSISVYAEYLLRKSEAAAAAGEARVPEAGDIEKLRRIAEGAQRILTFARDLVQYASPAGVDLDIVSINQVVLQSLSFCEHLFEKNGVVLEQNLGNGLASLYAVPGQLEQVVINLVTNAVHAVGAEGRITVTTFAGVNSAGSGGTIGFSVGDSGAGIAPDDRERVFEPFFTTKTDGQGTGLGLSIVRNIVEQHKGTIRVDASEAGGALFTIELPANR